MKKTEYLVPNIKVAAFLSRQGILGASDFSCPQVKETEDDWDPE